MTKTTPSPAKRENNAIIANPPGDLNGRNKIIAGSMSDPWNAIVANQAINTSWRGGDDEAGRERTFHGIVQAMVGIGPKDEIEGMLAAQLIATHNAAMECYRRASHPDQTFDGRSLYLTQGGKQSRTFAKLVEALNRHRGKGQQKVTVEHVHVHSGGQAIVGSVTGGRGASAGSEPTP